MVEKMMIDSIRKKVIDNFRTEHPYSYECIKQEGRVEGAIKELVDLYHYICYDININEKDLLEFIDKRLKVLGGKV